MENYRDPKASAQSIKGFAYKVQRRLLAAGAASHSIEDIEQELWVAWCKAVEAYSPSGGASFKTFLYRGMQMHANRYCENQVTRRHGEVIAASLDQPVGSEDDSGTLAEVIAADEASPEEVVQANDTADYVLKRLSPRARQFINLLKDQPEILMKELRALEAKAEHASQRGLRFSVHRRLTTWMVLDLMDARRDERNRILAEINQLSNLMAAR